VSEGDWRIFFPIPLRRDSQGNPWTSNYIVSNGNLLADMRHNVTAESQGRLQAARLYNLTQNRGVRDMLAFNIARDTMHQNQWLAAIEKLEKDGLKETPVPSNFPQEREFSEVAYRFIKNFSRGEESTEGRWASGPSKDGKGQFEYVADPQAMGPEVEELAHRSSRACTRPPSCRCRRPLPEQGRSYLEGRGIAPRPILCLRNRTSENASSETVWKVLGGRDGGLRSTPWRAGDTPQICPTTNGIASARICPSPQDKDAPGFTAYGRSSTLSSTS
jgi:hypothetical protein